MHYSNFFRSLVFIVTQCITETSTYCSSIRRYSRRSCRCHHIARKTIYTAIYPMYIETHPVNKLLKCIRLLRIQYYSYQTVFLSTHSVKWTSVTKVCCS